LIKSADTRRRIVILARSLEVGGAETQLTALAMGLPSDRFDVTVACLYARGRYLDVLEAAGIKIVPLKKRGRWDILGFLLGSTKTLKSLQPDVLHSFLTPPNILSALLKNQLAPCKLVWGLRASNVDMSIYDWTWRLTFHIERLLSGRPDCIVANAESGRAYSMAQGFSSAAMTVIPNGIDTDKFVFNEGAGRSVRNEFGLDLEAPVIGIVARLDPIKDHRTFLQAAAKLSASDPTVRFLCVGSGVTGFESSLKQMAATVGLGEKIIWAGQRHDLPAIYGALDILSLTSTSEGFPNTLAEGMACEVPSIATDVGDTKLLVGDTGLVAPVGDIVGIVHAWQKLISETPAEKRTRQLNCRQRIENKFSLEAMIEAHSRLYEQLCEMRSADKFVLS
jgi:glycosyltransferase involved in cell wall biosynthesis